MKKIGFIGVGIMGKPMVRNLMKAGYEVSIYTRTKAKVEDVINIGDMIWVKVTEIDEKGRVNLSYKDALRELENNPGLKK